MYLLDTSACVVHLRSRGQSTLSRKLLSISPRLIFVCPIVRGELIVGALHITTNHLQEESWPIVIGGTLVFGFGWGAGVNATTYAMDCYTLVSINQDASKCF